MVRQDLQLGVRGKQGSALHDKLPWGNEFVQGGLQYSQIGPPVSGGIFGESCSSVFGFCQTTVNEGQPEGLGIALF
jgi:hypothetical protein